MVATWSPEDVGEEVPEQLIPQRGVRWLVCTQREDGSWDEPQFTGTGFPNDFYIKYHLYALSFPVMALARYLRRVA